MPRRTRPKSTYKRSTWDQDETPLTYDQMAMRLVIDGKASPHILGELHPRVDLSRLPNEPTEENR